jgi:hypothetical protein
MSTVVACIAILSACARAHRETDATSPTWHPGLAGTEADPDAIGGHLPNSSFAGTTSAETSSGPASFVAESAAAECRGAGFYGYLEGVLRVPCCAGFHEYFVPGPGLAEMQKVCRPSPGSDARVCIKGECGDGVCEDGEDAACGCVADCPAAAWEGTTMDDVHPNEANGFSEPPASCDKREIVRRIQTSSGSIDCGGLLYEASSAQIAAAIHCVRNAYNAMKPFHVFWQVLVNHRPSSRGLVARLEDGRLQAFDLEFYDVEAHDLGLDGASATWTRVSLHIDPNYSHSFETCIEVTWLDRTRCDCLPQGKRPDAPAGDKVELRCVSQ